MRSLVLLGMHRSGTSMVANAMEAAGFYAGEARDMLASQPDNPRGFCERRDVVALNDELLAAAGGNWFTPPAQLSAPGAEQAAEMLRIRDQLSVARTALVKDPRLALTWPLWQTQFSDAEILYVYRDPASVALSLKARHGFPLPFGLALWEWYNRQILQHCLGERPLALNYAEVLSQPATAMGSLVEQLANRGMACNPEAAVAVVESSLDHSGRSERSVVDAFITPAQQELADHALALCAGTSPIVAPGKSNSAGVDLHWLQEMGGSMEALAAAHTTESLSLELAERTQERDTVITNYEKLHQEQLALAEAHKATLDENLSLLDERKETTVELADRERDQAFLFNRLNETYRRLLGYEYSTLAGVSRWAARVYKLLTLRPGIASAYDEVLEEGRQHLAEHRVALPERQQGKLGLMAEVLAYVARNPAGSARSFSLPRLKRAASIFLRSSSDDLEVWVNSRFPAGGASDTRFDPASLGESLDSLRLVFPITERPRVSILVPVFNDYRVTLQCLRSVLEHSADVAYEVIVADDGSSDLTASIGERVSNITVVCAPNNLGFLRNCNHAAQSARGEYLLLLNNDTAVTDNWLQGLLSVLDARPEAGVVGPKLLFADGRLQEAGGIMWRDGSAWNYGRMDDPGRPEYNYLRETDYVSGACLMLRRSLWQQLEGFDERYVPAYYEDADICFRAREAGYGVWYQPASTVFHFEGVSHGTDLEVGVKQHQVVNQKRFAERWSAALKREHFANGEHVFQARDRSRGRRCILIIDHYVPHYDKDAGSRSTFMYVQLMVEMGYRVVFLGANFFPHQPYTASLQELGVEVLVGEHMARSQDRWLQDNAPYIDTIYLHRPHIAEQILDSLDRMQPRPQIVYFGHDLHYLRVERECRLSDDESLKRSALNWRKREYAVFDRVDRVYYPSTVEVEEIRQHRPRLQLRAIPLYALDIEQLPEYNFGDAPDMLFVGGFNHPPNVDGICWFTESILPQIQAVMPAAHLHVVGSNPTDAVQDLQSDSTTVYGYLSDDDLDALYRRCRLVVVPLRFGAGIKGKVVEAVEKNLPLVTTAVGAEGLPDAQQIMAIADDEREFALAVIQRLSDEQLASATLQHYPAWLQKNFCKENARRVLLEDFGLPVREPLQDSVAAAPDLAVAQL